MILVISKVSLRIHFDINFYFRIAFRKADTVYIQHLLPQDIPITVGERKSRDLL